MKFFDRLRAGLRRVERRPLDEAFWEEFEEILIGADFGVTTTEKIVAALQGVAKQDRYETSDQVIARFKRDVKIS